MSFFPVNPLENGSPEYLILTDLPHFSSFMDNVNIFILLSRINCTTEEKNLKPLNGQFSNHK